ncbi:MAG TPA: 1-deoxy-D-xylulose-5-phosphate synthase N-terminal domain-containing protein [Candidatus Dojkabacteria bacterium]|nr:1-deoxy-D-xylulose-5-phosphate synthase N-terminal domain-containing protein [Candidatus Dojkabacteria bacterium]
MMGEGIPKFENETHNDQRLINLRNIADIVRARAFETILEADTGHLGGCSSSTELMTALYFGGYLDYDPLDAKNPDRDLVLIRGHEGPLRYTIFTMIGFLDRAELSGYRKFGTRLHGHEEMHETPGVDISPSGSLGMLLSYGTGAALEAKREDKNNKIVVFLGDGEEQEGNVSEAARNAAAIGLDNLVVIIDQNGKQLSRETAYADGKTAVPALWKAYGWEVLEIDNGHDLSQIDEVYDAVFNRKRNCPVCIVAHTVKGVTLPNIEKNYSGAHTIGAYDDNDAVQTTIDEIRRQVQERGMSEDEVYMLANSMTHKGRLEKEEKREARQTQKLNINIDAVPGAQLVPSHSHYFHTLGDILESAGKNRPNFYFMTADLLKKPLVDDLGIERIGQMLDLGIREQHTMATAHGISTMDPDARITMFMGDAFVYRFMDQLNATGQGRSRALIIAEKAGLCQSTNGLSHQSIGQSLGVLGIPFVQFSEPADVVDFYAILNKFYSENPGLVYVRLHNKKFKGEEIISPEMPRTLTYYPAYEPKTSPAAVIASAGFPLCNAFQAARTLEVEHGVGVRVVNIVDPKSLDNGFANLILDGLPLIVLYNGNADTLAMPVGKALVSSAIRPSVFHSVGYDIGTTGSLKDLEKHFKLDKDSIIDKVLEIA